jgi:putative transposase
LIDEAAYLSEPLRRRSWSLRGKRPILKVKSRSFKLSALNALCVSPRQHITQYFKIQPQAFDQADFISVICELRRVTGRPIIVVWDNLRAHKAAEKKILLLKKRGIEFESLPPYAPELNPVEPSWSQSKYGDMANFTPENLDELEQAVCQSLRKQRGNQKLLRSFFQAAKLPLDPPKKRKHNHARK